MQSAEIRRQENEKQNFVQGHSDGCFNNFDRKEAD